VKTLPSAQAFLAGAALFIMGALALIMAFHPVPQINHDYLIFILGGLAGALTVGGGAKLADKITTSNGPDATIQPDANKGPLK